MRDILLAAAAIMIVLGLSKQKQPSSPAQTSEQPQPTFSVPTAMGLTVAVPAVPVAAPKPTLDDLRRQLNAVWGLAAIEGGAENPSSASYWVRRWEEAKANGAFTNASTLQDAIGLTGTALPNINSTGLVQTRAAFDVAQDIFRRL